MSSVYDKTLGFLAGGLISSPSSSTSWALGDISTCKTRTHSETNGSMEEITGTCIATEVVEEPTPDREATEAIIKIKIQLTPWDSDIRMLSNEAWREIQNLQELTEAGCSSTPRLLEYFTYKQNDQMYYPGGYIVFIVMEKVHGQDLQNFGSLSLEERDSVRIAFIKALWEFRNQGFYHGDPRRSNVVWDKTSQRCFIIDLEDAWKMELSIQKRITLDPVVELSLWELNSGDAQLVDDPMMPEQREDGWTFDSLERVVAFLQHRRDIS